VHRERAAGSAGSGSGPPGAPGAGAGRRAGSAGPGAPGLFWTRREPLPGAAGRELELELEGGELEGAELEGGGPGAGHKKPPALGRGSLVRVAGVKG